MTFALLSGLLGAFDFGAIEAFWGSVKLRLAERISVDNATFGRLVGLFRVTGMAMAVVGGVLVDSIGHRLVILSGMTIAAVAIALIGRGRSVRGLVVTCVLLGAGEELVNLGANTLLPFLFRDPSAGSLLGTTCFSLGGLVLPILIAWLFRTTSYRMVFVAVAVLVGAPVVFAVWGTFPVLPRTFNTVVALGLLASPVTWVSGATLFCCIGINVALSVWLTTYAAELGAAHGAASRTLSLYYLVMMLSRLAFSLQDRVTGIDLTPHGVYLLPAGAVVMAAGIAAMARARTVNAGAVGVAVTAIAYGPLFPIAVGVTLRHFAPSTWGTLFGVIFALGLAGASVFPVWVGQASTGRTVRSTLGILRTTALVLGLLGFVLGSIPPAR
jgi:MFS family permease